MGRYQYSNRCCNRNPCLVQGSWQSGLLIVFTLLGLMDNHSSSAFTCAGQMPTGQTTD